MIYHKKVRKQKLRFISLYRIASVISFLVVLVLFLSFLSSRRFSFKPRAEEASNNFITTDDAGRDHFYQQIGPWKDTKLLGVENDTKCYDHEGAQYSEYENYIKGSGCGQTAVAMILRYYYKMNVQPDKPYQWYTPDNVASTLYPFSSCGGTGHEENEEVLTRDGFTVTRLIGNDNDVQYRKLSEPEKETLIEYLNEGWELFVLAVLSDPKDPAARIAHYTTLIAYDEIKDSFISWDSYFGPNIVFSEYNPQYLFVSAVRKDPIVVQPTGAPQ